MREIKFRAWDKFEKQWMDAPIIDGANGKMMAFSPLDGTFVRQFSDAEVEIVEYTGIDSEDGLEIFEGDIVKQEETLFGVVDTDLELTGVVKMLEGCWVIDSGKDSVYLWSETACHQILGNIYENPELLEVEANA